MRGEHLIFYASTGALSKMPNTVLQGSLRVA